MHAALLLLAAGLPGDNPVRVERDIIAPPGPLELRGLWEGLLSREGSTDFGAAYQDGRLTLPMTPAWTARLALTDEGRAVAFALATRKCSASTPGKTSDWC